MCDYGFADIFLTAENLDLSKFYLVFKQMVVDNFIQEWNGKIETNKVLRNYKLYKYTFTENVYLDKVPHDLRFYLTRLRLNL